MARPRNILVVRGNAVVSVTPKSLKSFLSGVASGTRAELTGKVLGETAVDLTTTTVESARAILGRMFPEPTPAPTPAASTAVVVASVPAVTA
jgi:hypothetical protein